MGVIKINVNTETGEVETALKGVSISDVTVALASILANIPEIAERADASELFALMQKIFEEMVEDLKNPTNSDDDITDIM